MAKLQRDHPGELQVTSRLSPLIDAPVVGHNISITGTVRGEDFNRAGAIVFAIDLAGQVSREQLLAHGISLSDAVGPFVYLKCAKDDPHRFENSIRVPEGATVKCIYVKLWNSRGPVYLSGVHVAGRAEHPKVAPILANISVDVEALPHRASDNHVDRLVFGKFDDGEFGISAQMRLFRELQVPATFYLELGECALWGTEKLAKAGRLIMDSGFDLQLHLHSEVLIRALKWTWPDMTLRPDLGVLDEQLTRRSLEYAFHRFHEITGTSPIAFRAGGYRFNRYTVDVGTELGIRAFSNYRADQRGSNAFDFVGPAPTQPFRWASGAYEFPITLSPEPLSSLAPEECWRRILYQVDQNRTWVINIVIHSWSFMHRDRSGYHKYENGSLEAKLRRIIEMAPDNVTFASMSDIVEFSDRNSGLFDLIKDPSDLRPNASI